MDSEIAKSGPKSFARRDHLRQNETKAQEKWNRLKVFEASNNLNQSKFLVTFPYPYMNGRLHLGHAFSITKAEFAARFQRMLGKNVLFPFGFHCTGMPIQAAANKLKEELESFGFPPVFPSEVDIETISIEDSVESSIAAKGKGKKSKLVNKGQAGKKLRQYDIMSMMVNKEEIAEFVDPLKWLSYFPPLGISDLKAFGASVDWRRSFITTSSCPYYDAFIRWQFNLLLKGGRIKNGFRPSVYSIKDQQVCADHDRASGEGICPQEYTLIKLKVINPPSNSALANVPELVDKKIFLVAATLRPETMYGQTNCFVLPEGDYGAYLFKEDEIYIISERSALGLAHQGFALEWGKLICLAKLKGSQLIGTAVQAPMAQYECVYVLPLVTISMGKGTGVVTSVPSDAPDDYMALKELKQKPLWREKFGVAEYMVNPFEIIPIIDIPGLGTSAAATLCEEKEVKSLKDKENLVAIKELVYTKGFYEGILIVGECQGMKVFEAKPIIRQKLIEAGEALPYFEPESLVISRSGDECIVAFTNQWYLSYGENQWKDQVIDLLGSNDFNCYNTSILDAFLGAANWLKEWACSREFGLGTQLPWDKKWVIDSLSDSTIYMAYYTIAKFFHGNSDLSGSKLYSGIDPVDLTDEVFSYIFLNEPLRTEVNIPMQMLVEMKKEFEYWYPVDLRVSAKDLIPNHLTMCLYNHVEIWKDHKNFWPRGMFCNGHIMVDAEKMSKSKGNFLMMLECIEEYSADATRFALADAGDGLEDANFDRSVANQAVSYLFIEEEWIREYLSELSQNHKRTEVLFMDKVFDNELNFLIESAKAHYESLNFREALHKCWYEMIILRDFYRDWCIKCEISLNSDITLRFIKSLILMMQPICPHWSETLFELFHEATSSVCNAEWPHYPAVNATLRKEFNFLKAFVKNLRNSMVKQKATAQNALRVFVAHTYEQKKISILQFMQKQCKFDGSFEADFSKKLKIFIENNPELKSDMKNLMQFGSFMKSESEERGPDALTETLSFDQVAILKENAIYLQKSLEIVEIDVIDSNCPINEEFRKKFDSSVPGKPSFSFYLATA